MTEDRTGKGNGTWGKVVVCVMGAITLFSTGWAASSTTAWLDVKRIDAQGSQKAQMLEVRVTKIETTVDVSLKGINDKLDQIAQDFRRHQATTAGPRPGTGGN